MEISLQNPFFLVSAGLLAGKIVLVGSFVLVDQSGLREISKSLIDEVAVLKACYRGFGGLLLFLLSFDILQLL